MVMNAVELPSSEPKTNGNLTLTDFNSIYWL